MMRAGEERCCKVIPLPLTSAQNLTRATTMLLGGAATLEACINFGMKSRHLY